MKKKLTTIIILILILTFSGLLQCKEKEEIFVFDKEHAPFSFMDDGKPAGFDIDILNAIFADSKVELNMLPYKWRDALENLKKGNVDIISELDKTEDRMKIYDFCDTPYLTDHVKIFVKDENIKSLNDLKGKKVAVQKGSIYQTILEKVDGIIVEPQDSEFENLKLLNENKVDAFVGPAKVAYYIISKYNYEGIRGIGTPIKKSIMYFAVKKGDYELLRFLNNELIEIKFDGTYDKIYQKWFVEDVTTDEINELIDKAKKATIYAYAPYSNYYVGAAVLTKSGKIYTGCNIENALLGLTTSAVKVALYKAISEGDTEIKAILNYLPNGTLGAPTADERQIIYEFGRGIQVIVEFEKDYYDTFMISELLPFAFELE